MQAVILAAGKGTRMGDLTRGRPKLLLKIDNKTILEHNLEAMPDEIDEVILVVGYMDDKIREKFGDAFSGKKLTYVVQKELKGTAHALHAAKSVLKGQFLVIYGDDLYSKSDLGKLVKFPLGVLVMEAVKEDLTRTGPASSVLGEKGFLVNILERQLIYKGSLINTGAYVLDQRFFDYPLVSAGDPATEYGLPQTFVQMIKDGAQFNVVKATFWKRISEPKDLEN